MKQSRLSGQSPLETHSVMDSEKAFTTDRDSPSPDWMRKLANPHNKLLSFWVACIMQLESIYMHIAMILLGLLNSVFYWHDKSMLVGGTGVFVLAFMVHATFPLSALSNAFCCLRKRKHLKYPLRKATVILESISNTEGTHVHKILYAAAAVSSIALILFLIAIYVFGLIILKSTVGLHTVTFLHQSNWVLYYLYINCCITNFFIHAAVSGQCFEKMRKFISTTYSTPETYVCQFLSDYDHLMEYCQKLNKYFGPQHFWILCWACCTLTVQFYIFIGKHVLWIDSMQSTVGIVVLSTALLLCLIWIPLFLILSCSVNENQAEKFNEDLSSLVMRDTSGSLVSNPYITAHFTIGKKLKFSACGCFYVDYRLGYSMLAACITYLVILVEFDDKSSSSATTPITPSPVHFN